MSNTSETHRSNIPNGPHISHKVYVSEREKFVGDAVAAMLYGIAIILFFQCLMAMFVHARHTRGGIRWGLAAHTVTMFSLVTIATGMGLNLQTIAYVDNRDFPGTHTGLFAGPIGYKQLIYTSAISIVPNITFQLNQWLADGLLLYRCCIVYAMNYWVTTTLSLIYLTSLAMGLVDLIWNFQSDGGSIHFSASTPYYLISLSLNILLTLMIIIRLILHSREIRQAMGIKPKTGGLYKAIVILLAESCALYSISLLPFIILSIIPNSFNAGIFWPIVNETQVIAPFLIVRQIANPRAVTSDSTSWNTPSIRFEVRGESMGDSWTTSGSGGVVGPVSASGEAPSEGAVKVGNTVEVASS